MSIQADNKNAAREAGQKPRRSYLRRGGSEIDIHIWNDGGYFTVSVGRRALLVSGNIADAQAAVCNEMERL
jgi:hypothetical protein